MNDDMTFFQKNFSLQGLRGELRLFFSKKHHIITFYIISFIKIVIVIKGYRGFKRVMIFLKGHFSGDNRH
jgi:hypothetical protein